MSFGSLADEWDVVVVGAGLGGSVAARRLSESGAKVLLVDRATFPRGKVCGCCLGPMAMRTLEAFDVLPALDTLKVARLTLATPMATRSLALGTTQTASREQLDQVLVHRAEAAGATFVGGCTAKIDAAPPASGSTTVGLRSGTNVANVRAKVIVDAAGLGSHRGATAGRTAPYIGLGAMLGEDTHGMGTDELRMAATSRGYLGAAPLADGRATLAAALKRDAMHTAGARDVALHELADLIGIPLPAVAHATFRGVPPVRVRQAAQTGNVFRVGDAARFVEPITGEGMGWALAAGDAVTPHILAHLRNASARPTWPRALPTMLRKSQRRCAGVAALVHRPAVLGALLRLLPATATSGIATAASGRSTQWRPA